MQLHTGLSFLTWEDLDGVDPLKNPFSNITIILSYYCDNESSQCIHVEKGDIISYSSLVATAQKADIPLGSNTTTTGFLQIHKNQLSLVDTTEFKGPFLCRHEAPPELSTVFNGAVTKLRLAVTAFHHVTDRFLGIPGQKETTGRSPRALAQSSLSIGGALAEWISLEAGNILVIKEELLKLALGSYTQASSTRNLTAALISGQVASLNGDYALAFYSFWLQHVFVMNDLTVKLSALNGFLNRILASAHFNKLSQWECGPGVLHFLNQDCFAGSNTIRQTTSSNSEQLNLVLETGKLVLNSRSETICVPYLLHKEPYICDTHQHRQVSGDKAPPLGQRPIRDGDESLLLGDVRLYFLLDKEKFTVACLPTVTLSLNGKRFSCSLTLTPDTWFQLPLRSLNYAGVEYVYSDQVAPQQTLNLTLQRPHHSIAKLPRFWVHRHRIGRIQELQGVFKRLRNDPSGITSLIALVLVVLLFCCILPLCCKVVPSLANCLATWVNWLTSICSKKSTPVSTPTAPPLPDDAPTRETETRLQALPLLFTGNPVVRRATLND